MLYTYSCRACVTVQNVTDAGFKVFSAAVQSSSIQIVDLFGLYNLEDYVVSRCVALCVHSLAYNTAFEKVTDTGMEAFLAGVQANANITTVCIGGPCNR